MLLVSLLITSTLLLTSCLPSISKLDFLPQSTRPVIKIGLIAPFEGLYRRTGYEGLSAARLAIESHRQLIHENGVDLIMQALDDSAHGERSVRAAEKLLIDPAVKGVIGPLASWAVANQVDKLPVMRSPVTHRQSVTTSPIFEFPWAQPRLGNDATKRYDPERLISQDELVLAVAKAASKQGMENLLVAGVEELVLAEESLIGLAVWKDNRSIEEFESILWLDEPAAGIALLNRLREEGWTAPFWFGTWGGDPVVRERSQVYSGIYWAIWQDARYTEWSKNHEPSSPFAYLVYRATERAIGNILKNEELGHDSASWQVVFYALKEDGLSYRFEP